MVLYSLGSEAAVNQNFSRLIVLAGLLRSDRMRGWPLLFLLTTIMTSVTAFVSHIKA